MLSCYAAAGVYAATTVLFSCAHCRPPVMPLVFYRPVMLMYLRPAVITEILLPSCCAADVLLVAASDVFEARPSSKVCCLYSADCNSPADTTRRACISRPIDDEGLRPVYEGDVSLVLPCSWSV